VGIKRTKKQRQIKSTNVRRECVQTTPTCSFHCVTLSDNKAAPGRVGLLLAGWEFGATPLTRGRPSQPTDRQKTGTDYGFVAAAEHAHSRVLLPHRLLLLPRQSISSRWCAQSVPFRAVSIIARCVCQQPVPRRWAPCALINGRLNTILFGLFLIATDSRQWRSLDWQTRTISTWRYAYWPSGDGKLTYSIAQTSFYDWEFCIRCTKTKRSGTGKLNSDHYNYNHNLLVIRNKVDNYTYKCWRDLFLKFSWLKLVISARIQHFLHFRGSRSPWCEAVHMLSDVLSIIQ